MTDADQNTPAPRLPPVALLAAITATGPMAMHLFVPSMPGLVESFDTTPGRVQLTLTLYMLALAVATLVSGPLADRFGRRPVILGALSVYTGAAIACALAWSVDALIAWRILQALGGAAGLTLGRTIVRDCFDASRSASMIAMLSMIMSVVPALSPAIGGYLDVWLGWRAGFALLALYGAVTLLAAIPWLNETYARPGGGLAAVHERSNQLQVFSALLRNRVFLGYGLHCVCTLSAWYGIVASAPYLMVTVMGHPPSEYGEWFVLVAAGWIGGNLLTSRIAPRIGIARLVLYGAMVAITASVLLLLVVAMDALTPAHLFLPLALLGVGHGLSQPGSMSGAIGVNPRAAGRASGLLGFVQITGGAATAQALGVMQNGSAWPMVVTVAVISALSLGCWWIATSGNRE